jgi:hypothetical protein
MGQSQHAGYLMSKSGYVVLHQSDVDALNEEFDLTGDPFWEPLPITVRCRNQGSPCNERACGFCHEGPCKLEVLESTT